MRAVLGDRRARIWGPAQARLWAVLARPILFRVGPYFGLLFSGRARAGPKSLAHIFSTTQGHVKDAGESNNTGHPFCSFGRTRAPS
jgi:hypothetical protein